MFRKKTGIALAALLFFCAGITGFATNGFGLFEKQETMQTAQQNDGGAILGNGSGNGLRLMSTKIAAADYEEYGVSPMAETAYQLTATITPEYAEDKTVDWSVAFDNPSSAWATGKTVTDYVTVTPTSDGALTANVECLQDFGEQIIVTVTSRDNEEVSAECTVDYAKRIESAYLVGMGGEHIAESGNTWQTGMYDSFTETYIPQYMTYWTRIDTNAYFVQETVNLDFDIIDVTFTKDGVSTVIPVVSDPIDNIPGITPPANTTDDDGPEWWRIVLAVLLLLIVLVILAPVLPYIGQAIVWVISLPFRLIGWIINSIKKTKKKK